MSQAEALLNSLSETVIDHKHVVPDSDTYFIIDPYTRLIENTNYNKTVLMRGDHNSERFTFEIPRYVDGHDMSLCNRVTVHFDNVGDSIENIHSDVAYMDDLQINPDKPDTVISSWLIRREATQIVGILSFSLQYQCVEGEEITYEWNTDSYDEIEIRKSKNNGEAAIIKYTNVLEQWRSQIFGAGDSVMANISAEGATQVTAVQTESATQQAAIELKGSETLASIPEDYTEVYNMASEAVRTKADGVVCEAEGAVIAVADASDDYIRGLNVYGKTTQFTTTGKNLLPIHATTRTSNGITYTVYDDGHIHVEGTADTNSWLWVPVQNGDERLAHIPAGTYFLSGNPNNNATGYINGWYADGTAIPQHNDAGSGKRVTLEQDAYVYYQIMVGTGSVVSSDFYPQLEVGESATSWEPYTGGVPSPNPDYPQDLISVENPIVEICGKNLARSNRDGVLKSLGVTITQINNCSEIVIDGTTTGATSITVFRDIYLRAGQYTLSADGLNVNDASYDRAYMMDGGANAIVNYVQTGRPQTFTVSEPKCVSISIVFAAGTSYSNRTVRFQLEEGSVATEYEPYTGVSISTAYTIPGVPVDANGNYTDSDGQQWICDEVDFERGVYVQRMGAYQFTGEETWTTSILQDGTEYIRYDSAILSELPSPIDVYNSWCSHFPVTTAPNKNGFWPNNSGAADRLLVRIKWNYTSGEELATFLGEQYAAGTPVSIKYILATPIETPLTAEEIETYKSIKTNYPNTTILNNANAWMKAKYNADTKLYISNTVEAGVVSVVEEVLNETY